MARGARWYFTTEQLINTPSRRTGVDPEKEARYRRHSVNFIRHVGQKLALPQLWINTASVLMHRFFMYQSFSRFDRNVLSLAVLFCVAKSFKEEEGRIYPGPFLKTAHACLYQDLPPLDSRSPQYEKQLEDLLYYEYVLLATLGFDLDIDHAHTHILKNSHVITATTAVIKVAHDIASRSLEYTTMCLQYKPTAVACFCLQLASHWTNWEMPQPKDGKAWFHEIDETLTQELINHLVAKFRHHVGDYYPHLRDKIISFCLRNSPFRPYPSPSDSPGRQPPKVVNPVPVSESHPLPSGPPELKKSLDTELRVPPLHSHPVQHAPYHLHPLPSPQADRKNHETSESCNQNPTDAKSRDLPNIRHQSIHNSSSHPSADPEHHHPDHHPRHLADHSPHEKPPNSSENHLNTQNTHKTPQTSFITPPESHPRNHVEHLQQPTDDNSLQISPDLQSVGYSKEKIVTSIAPAVPIVESNLEVSDDLLAMVPPENFDFENTFRNVIESLTSMTNSDASRLCKSDPEKTESTQEPSWSLSTFDSTDSGIFSQSSSQPLGQGNVPQESDAPLKRLQEISEPVKSFSSIFDPPDDVNETLVQKFDDNCNDLSDSHKKKKKSKHKKERKEKKKSKKRERTVSPIKLKIPREKLGILGDKIDKDIGLEGSRRRKRQSETHYEVARKRCHGDKGERIRLTYEEVDYIEP